MTEMTVAEALDADGALAVLWKRHEQGIEKGEDGHWYCMCGAALPCAEAQALAVLSVTLLQLRVSLEPGKASAIVAGMFEAAQRFGHSPYSSKHALTYLVEEIERLRAALAEATTGEGEA